MSHNRTLSQSERDAFELTCVDAVNMGGRTLLEITERVQVALKARHEAWATVLARASNLQRRVYEALRRSTDRHHIRQGPSRDKFITWEPVIVGNEGTLIVDDPYEPTTDAQAQVVRGWFGGGQNLIKIKENK